MAFKEILIMLSLDKGRYKSIKEGEITELEPEHPLLFHPSDTELLPEMFRNMLDLKFNVALPSIRIQKWLKADHITYIPSHFDNKAYCFASFPLDKIEGVIIRDRQSLTYSNNARIKKKLSDTDDYTKRMNGDTGYPEAWREYLSTTTKLTEVNFKEYSLPELWIPGTIDVTKLDMVINKK